MRVTLPNSTLFRQTDKPKFEEHNINKKNGHPPEKEDSRFFVMTVTSA